MHIVQCCILTKMLQHLKKNLKMPWKPMMYPQFAKNDFAWLSLSSNHILSKMHPRPNQEPCNAMTKNGAKIIWFSKKLEIDLYLWLMIDWLVSSYFNAMTDFFKGYEDCFFNSHKTEGYGFLKKIASSFWKFSGCEYPAHAPPSNPLDKTHHHHIQITRLCPAL